MTRSSWLSFALLVGAFGVPGVSRGSPAPTPTPTLTPVPAPNPALLRVRGTQIVDGAGRPVVLRGVSFGNQVWGNVRLPRRHHDATDYARIAAMGMNAVRFYMNYRTFLPTDSDAAPGQFLADGWQWLDDNIAWAKKNGVYLVLNMHVPPGGFQSLGAGKALWQRPDLQERFIRLWTEIARHCRGEPTIAGYDLLNEPVVTTRQGAVARPRRPHRARDPRRRSRPHAVRRTGQRGRRRLVGGQPTATSSPSPSPTPSTSFTSTSRSTSPTRARRGSRSPPRTCAIPTRPRRGRVVPARSPRRHRGRPAAAARRHPLDVLSRRAVSRRRSDDRRRQAGAGGQGRTRARSTSTTWCSRSSTAPARSSA